MERHALRQVLKAAVKKDGTSASPPWAQALAKDLAALFFWAAVEATLLFDALDAGIDTGIDTGVDAGVGPVWAAVREGQLFRSPHESLRDSRGTFESKRFKRNERDKYPQPRWSIGRSGNGIRVQ